LALTGLPFLLVLAGSAVAVIALTMLLWNRWPGWSAFPLRLLSLLLVMLVGTAVAGDMVNRSFDFYSSFNDLLGNAGAGRGRAIAEPVQDFGAQSGTRRVIRVRLNGARSHLSREALFYLPAAYFQPSQAGRRFPVIELFHGYPGNPVNWFREMRVADVLDAEIAAGRIPPVIAVAPTDNDVGRDSECVNAVHGEQDETYLAADVPADISRKFRALATPHSWATVGYSTGGFCAVNLALHHPGRYAAAASLSGYFTPVVNGDTGDLYRDDAAAQRRNSPLWLAAHERPGASVPLYLVASEGDGEALQAMRAMRVAAGHRLPVVTVTLPAGGHNFHVWYSASLAAFPWLGGHLAGAAKSPATSPAA
jgi:S-formylglutathione hydrolase FrmB